MTCETCNWYRAGAMIGESKFGRCFRFPFVTERLGVEVEIGCGGHAMNAEGREKLAAAFREVEEKHDRITRASVADEIRRKIAAHEAFGIHVDEGLRRLPRDIESVPADKKNP